MLWSLQRKTLYGCTHLLFDWNYLLVEERVARRVCCEVSSGKQRRKNVVIFATEVVDSLLGVERHSVTVIGLPPKEPLQKCIHWSWQLLFCCKFGWRSNTITYGGSMCSACPFSPVEELHKSTRQGNFHFLRLYVPNSLFWSWLDEILCWTQYLQPSRVCLKWLHRTSVIFSITGMRDFIAIPELCESWIEIVELFPNRIHQCLYYPQCKAMTSDRKTWLQ